MSPGNLSYSSIAPFKNFFFPDVSVRVYEKEVSEKIGNEETKIKDDAMRIVET